MEEGRCQARTRNLKQLPINLCFMCSSLTPLATLLAKFEIELDEWISNYIISYADYLINIEPKDLKDKIKNKGRKITDL